MRRQSPRFFNGVVDYPHDGAFGWIARDDGWPAAPAVAEGVTRIETQAALGWLAGGAVAFVTARDQQRTNLPLKKLEAIRLRSACVTACAQREEESHCQENERRTRATRPAFGC